MTETQTSTRDAHFRKVMITRQREIEIDVQARLRAERAKRPQPAGDDLDNETLSRIDEALRSFHAASV